MMSTAIEVNNISKRFRIPHHKKNTFFQNAIGFIKRQYDYEEFLALKNISFEVGKGEAFGIIGRNGSGKSTLLKILARVLYPDKGSISISGKVAPFLELGVGFQTELSARENVYIYSSILGMTRKQTDRVYQEVFDFAELTRFQDMKLLNFSSGMYLRLAFSTAVHANPDVILIDEVLAVGDEAFQKKCMEKINSFKAEGKTIIFVSHSFNLIKAICSRAVLLENGAAISFGDPETIHNQYLSMVSH
ncbi:MAG: ABC transporter ATP-binding protein [Dehalococcoidia bacterium]